MFRRAQNELVMLPEAAKKVRFLRSDFKRRMEADGKTMTPDERCATMKEKMEEKKKVGGEEKR